MKFEEKDNKIMLSLPKHIQHGLEELGLTNCKTSATPMTPNIKLVDATDDDHARFKKLNINYRSAIGLLNHIAQLTRPDISFAVSCLARHSGTADLKLTLEIRNPNELLQIFSDASWGDDPQDRTSQSGYLCFLFGSLPSSIHLWMLSMKDYGLKLFSPKSGTFNSTPPIISSTMQN
ncbi:hypothetical protein VP01_1546g2 [Puccinia sorghi]|uniref:Reverse transcriptase Ty1/copia-type domain-containing protein n=1 Tax=Puccinia sorghi TaxID=27349 RepID=A0A0L6VI86_9BASI|nr:hypothetical protein VP01_1546g2 [Puccinia sorghi]